MEDSFLDRVGGKSRIQTVSGRQLWKMRPIVKSNSPVPKSHEEDLLQSDTSCHAELFQESRSRVIVPHPSVLQPTVAGPPLTHFQVSWLQKDKRVLVGCVWIGGRIDGVRHKILTPFKIHT
jgi:hypothetical protein